jgi:hypothetical protein
MAAPVNRDRGPVRCTRYRPGIPGPMELVAGISHRGLEKVEYSANTSISWGLSGVLGGASHHITRVHMVT